jgi:hypothetical protein
VSVETLPRPTVTRAPDSVTHLYCCDPNLAFCGLDITDEPYGCGGEAMCPLCVLVDGGDGPECCR